MLLLLLLKQSLNLPFVFLSFSLSTIIILSIAITELDRELALEEGSVGEKKFSRTVFLSFCEARIKDLCFSLCKEVSICSKTSS